VTGTNNDDPDLGANGIGKSTIFEALYWCLYGKTTRGVRGQNISHNFKKEDTVICSVSLTTRGKDYIIRRTWNPIELTVECRQSDSEDEYNSPKVVDQSYVDSVVGLSAREFQNSILVSQFSQMFFDMSPSEKLKSFSNIMGLDYWSDCSSHARETTSQFNEKIEECEEKLTVIGKLIENVNVSLADSKKRSRLFNSDRNIKITQLRKDITGVKKEIDDITTQIKKDSITRKNVAEELLAMGEEYDLLVSERDSIDSKMQDVDTQIKIYKSKDTDQIKLQNRFESVTDSCPYCLQEVKHEYIDEELSKIKKELLNIKKTAQKYASKYEKLNDTRRLVVKKLHNFESKMDDSDDKFRYLDDKITTLKTKREGAKKTLRLSKEKIGSLREEKNPFDEVIENFEEKLINFKTDKRHTEKEKTSLLKLRDGSNFWINGFKDVRLFVIRRALTQLEIEVNSCLSQLGLAKWSIFFTVERENRQGGIVKGFTVHVKSPMDNAVVPWEVWSGGESQRMRIAETMGLANLILNQKGINSNIQIFDEPTQHLSQEGIDALIELLQNKSVTESKQMWLVDHRSLDVSKFAHTLIVNKKGGYSRVTITY